MDYIFIYKIMREKCKNNKRNIHYLKRYIRFIKYCNEYNEKSNYSEKYYENHHILPKSEIFWPEYSSFKDFPWNKSVLTIRQHIIAHWMLARALEKSMWYALKLISTGIGFRPNKDFYVNSRIIEESKIKNIEYKTELFSGDGNPMYGKKHTEESKLKMKKSLENRRKRTDEENKQLSLKTSGIPKEKIKCPHCSKVGGKPAMMRYHFDNCIKLDKNNDKSVECPFCSKTGKIGPMTYWHFDNCKFNPDIQKIKCYVCGDLGSKSYINRFHNDRCKHKK